VRSTLELTPREHEVMALLIEGYSNPEIGDKLGTREGTVKTQLYYAFEKLGARNRAHAAAIYVLTTKKPESGAVQTQRAEVG
jgi:DNA-binding CsgD family transcriptional regulator